LPFTDLIRDPKGRDIVRNVLLGLDWQVRTDANAGFILGDAAFCTRKRIWDRVCEHRCRRRRLSISRRPKRHAKV
jgi:hypothetical protein